MQHSQHVKWAWRGILIAQLFYWIRAWLLFSLHGDLLKITEGVFMAFLTMGALVLIQAAWGIYRQRAWGPNQFLAVGGLLILILIPATFKMGGHSLWFALVLPSEAFCYLFVLFHLAKIPSETWQPQTKGWRRFFQAKSILPALFWLVFLELGLQVGGLDPGKIFQFRYFQKVDELILWEDYSANAAGITAFNQQGADLAATGMWKGEKVKRFNANIGFAASSYSVYEDFQELRDGDSEGPFADMLDSLLQLPPDQLDSLDRAHLLYRQRPINDDGFRSIPFVPYPGPRKKVLLLGDSFTFGWSARPWTQSFADYLRTLGYVVYNAGITATGPDQYEAIAREYIPRLQPDFVIVNFFMGNDILHYPVHAEPHKMVFYPTNAGLMQAYPGYEHLPDPETAYQFMVNEYYIQPNDWFSSLCSSTALGTMTWRVAQRFDFLSSITERPNEAYFERNAARKSPTPVSEQYLLNIKQWTEDHGGRFIGSIIPDVRDLSPDLDRDYPDLFPRLNMAVPSVTMDDYHPTEEHFNVPGHRRYALFLDSLMGGSQ